MSEPSSFLRLQACLLLLLTLTSCALFPFLGKTPAAAPANLAAEARRYERLAQRSQGQAAAEAWRAAGLLWVDPENSQASYGRALACFRRAQEKAMEDPLAARSVRAWIAVLSRLVSAEEAAKEAESLRSALKDAAETSDALRGRAPAVTAEPPRQ